MDVCSFLMVHYTIICSCKDDSEEIIQALRHYTKAKVDGGFVYGLGDDAHVKVSSSLNCCVTHFIFQF
jgi:hypothetical protein